MTVVDNTAPGGDESGYRRITGSVGTTASGAGGQTRPDAGRVRGLIEDSEARGYRGRGDDPAAHAEVKRLIATPDEIPVLNPSTWRSARP